MKWRAATKDDYPGIERCHHALEAKLGEEMDLPAFAHPAILAWFVAEREGEIVQFSTLEGVVEFRMGGCDREALQEMLQSMGPEILANTRAMQTRFIHIPVPPSVEKQVARKLKKLKIDRSSNSFYVADLR